jgi:hypothetical protein
VYIELIVVLFLYYDVLLYMVLTIPTILSTVYRQFLFLGMILAASVDVSTILFICASYFSRPISLEKPRNPLKGSDGSFLTLQQYPTFCNLPT